MPEPVSLPDKHIHFDLSRDDAQAAKTLLTRICAAHRQPDSAVVARCLVSAQQQRRHFFDKSLFGDPAWDMLLALFVALKEGKALSITSLIFSADMPQTTGLRWVNVLEQAGLVTRKPCPDDGRRVMVALSAQGEQKFEDYLARFAAVQDRLAR